MYLEILQQRTSTGEWDNIGFSRWSVWKYKLASLVVSEFTESKSYGVVIEYGERWIDILYFALRFLARDHFFLYVRHGWSRSVSCEWERQFLDFVGECELMSSCQVCCSLCILCGSRILKLVVWSFQWDLCFCFLVIFPYGDVTKESSRSDGICTSYIEDDGEASKDSSSWRWLRGWLVAL